MTRVIGWPTRTVSDAVSYEDKIDQLARALDHVDQHVRKVDANERRERRNRLNMLHLHSAAAVLIGILFAIHDPAALTGANWAIARLIPGMPVSLGLLLLIGGLILGPATHLQSLRWEKTGLWIIMAWYAIIAFSFAGSSLLYLAGRNPSATTPAFYASLVYLHLTCVMIVHLATLNRMTRVRRLSP
jgi:uncharacterized membrane protein SirB2